MSLLIYINKETWFAMCVDSLHAYLAEMDESKPLKDRSITKLVMHETLDTDAARVIATNHRSTRLLFKETLRNQLCINPAGSALLDAAWSACQPEARPRATEDASCAWSGRLADTRLTLFGNGFGYPAQTPGARTEHMFDIHSSWLDLTHAVTVVGNVDAWLRQELRTEQLRTNPAIFHQPLVLTKRQRMLRHTFNDCVQYLVQEMDRHGRPDEEDASTC